MSCDQIEQFLPRYMENDLSEDDRRMIESHLASCAKCRRSLEAFAALEESLTSLKTAVPSWRTADERLSLIFGPERERSVAARVLNAPFAAGLSFIALGIVLFWKGNALFPALRSFGTRFAFFSDTLMQSLSHAFAEASGLNPAMLISIYVLLTLALLSGTGLVVLRFARK
ncbi:MAG: zf-HC2 domain-containing protein [Candidatus Krumholzibacteria bacterium]|nr:zf-HC2 domain-containing protein [Candidatus Krumholzibacteria bacterium]